MMTRRDVLALPATVLTAQSAPALSRMGIAATCFSARRPKDTLEFLEYCRSLGAGGIQAPLSSTEPEHLAGLRRKAEQHGMYIEVMAGLPRGEDAETFEQTLIAAGEVGARCARVACLGGRRYEMFSRLDEWKQFAASSQKTIARTLPLAEKHRMPLAIENHKDWTLEELLALLKEYSSEYIGVCLDTGNNIALLDEPMEFVECLSPYAVSTHLKDMAIEEYSEGFLLAEVPFGEGILDMPRIAEIIRRARPSTRMTLEMITRDPLRIPCLTEKYWATFADTSPQRLPAMLRTVRAQAAKRIPRHGTLPPEIQANREADNVAACLRYARERMSL